MTSRISPEWMAWITENLLRGASSEEVVAVLEAQGLVDAGPLVADLRRSGVLDGAHHLLARSAGVEQAARLLRTCERRTPFERAAPLDEAIFELGYWAAHRPVVLRGAAASWPAVSWTLDSLAERFGHVEVSAMVGRSRHARWWRHRDSSNTRMPFAELLRRVAEDEGDDCYAVGRNEVLAEPGLETLRGDLGLLPGCTGHPASTRLWIGPAGTRTPLHHDQSSAWLVQLVGRKRVWLASPLEVALLDTAEGVFNAADPREPATPEQREVRWLEAELGPGDAVFLPAGWWHQVVALAPSISVSLGGFRWPHDVSWYTPGRLGPTTR